MAKKKANGEGSVYKTKTGYSCQMTIGFDSVTGKQMRKTFSGKTKLEALKKKEEYIISVKTGNYVEPQKLTVSEWLNTWLNTFKKPTISAKTYDRYESALKVHLIPGLGNISLQKLRTEHIQDFYNSKQNNDECNGQKNLSTGSIKYIHMVLKQALDKAFQLNYINKNPEIYCTIPKATKTEVQSLSETEILKVVSMLNHKNNYDMAILVDLLTGLRLGELVSLEWTDIDFENGYISINKTHSRVINRDVDINKNKDVKDESSIITQAKYKNVIKQPKTPSSVRMVSLPESILPLLLEYRKKVFEENIKAGRNQNDYNLVFPSRKGTVIVAQNMWKHWKRLLIKANINHVKFHAIRHSYASLLLNKKVNPKVIQMLLGHSNLSTTMNIYVHASEDQKKGASAKINYLIDIKNEESTNNEKNTLREELKIYRIS